MTATGSGGPRAAPPRPLAFETPRLVVTPLVVDDADAMAHVLGDASLYTFIGGEPPTRDALRARYTRFVVGASPCGRERWLNGIVRTRAGGEAVGTVQATVLQGGAEARLAWVVGVPWQGRGYAKEAAAGLAAWLAAEPGIAVLTALVHPAHEASRAVARHLGLALTGEREDGEDVWRRGLA